MKKTQSKTIPLLRFWRFANKINCKKFAQEIEYQPGTIIAIENHKHNGSAKLKRALIKNGCPEVVAHNCAHEVDVCAIFNDHLETLIKNNKLSLPEKKVEG
jgi:DNA-binding XRE family transcriptional regulator